MSHIPESGEEVSKWCECECGKRFLAVGRYDIEEFEERGMCDDCYEVEEGVL